MPRLSNMDIQTTFNFQIQGPTYLLPRRKQMPATQASINIRKVRSDSHQVPSQAIHTYHASHSQILPSSGHNNHLPPPLKKAYDVTRPINPQSVSCPVFTVPRLVRLLVTRHRPTHKTRKRRKAAQSTQVDPRTKCATCPL